MAALQLLLLLSELSQEMLLVSRAKHALTIRRAGDLSASGDLLNEGVSSGNVYA